MTDTSCDGSSTLHRNSDIPVNPESNSGWCSPTGSGPAAQKRTRSQHNVPDLILRLPLSRSPLKDARRARTKTQGSTQADPQQHGPGDLQLRSVDNETMARVNGNVKASAQEAEHGTENEEQVTSTCADKREGLPREEEGSQDSLFSSASHDGQTHEDSGQHTMQSAATKKRASPDTDVIRTLSSPGGERQPKRAKVESLRALGRRHGHLEYVEPLRDLDTSPPIRTKGHKRISSMTQMLSSRNLTSSISYSRARSVPLGGDEVLAIDLTTIPPSPRRSPTKVEVRRALSVPPPDDDQMDIDDGDNSALLHFTNPTRFTSSPRANPVFRYTVNFATPRGSDTPPRSTRLSLSPLSPLTPLPASPLMGHLPQMQSRLAKKAEFNSLARSDRIRPGAVEDEPVTDITISMDVFQSTPVPSRPSSTVSTSRPSSVAFGPADASPSCLVPMIPSNSIDLRPAPPEGSSLTNPAGVAGRAKDVSSNSADDVGEVFTDTSELSSAPSSSPDSTAQPVLRPTIVGAMKPKRSPFIPQVPRRTTRSVSMKMVRVRGEHLEVNDTMAGGNTAEVPPTSELGTVPPLSAAITSKLRPSTSIGAATSKPTLIARRSASVSKPPPDTSKLKQASLNIFMKAKPSTIGGSAARTSTSTGSSSRILPPLSPSKIPLPASPLKRPSTTQSGSVKPLISLLGSGVGQARGTSGRSLTTLSHALDKLIVPPPSRPNTSMGFVGDDRASREDGALENAKGKGKAKDDASVPVASTAQGSGTFARPTASSLNRAATVMEMGSTATSKAWGRGRAMTTGVGKARGMIGIFGRAGDRASKRTNLPVVEGSPAKASESSNGLGSKHRSASSLGSTEDATSKGDVFVSQADAEQDAELQLVLTKGSMGGRAAAQKLSPLVGASANNGVDVDTLPISTDKGKQRASSSSTLNPASSALHALSESLSSLPQTPTPPKPRVVGTRTGLRSSTAATGKESPALDVSASTGPGGSSEVHGSGGAVPSSGPANGSGGVKMSSLKILKRCAIFVDVRTEQGDDAGGLFVDMLKGLGAKIMGRLGRRCTHIVYKNGHPTTLTRYRMLDVKPAVVGIAWVVECVEKRARVDEEKFKIDVDVINVASSNNKRRRSMLPKHLFPASPGPESETSMNISSEVEDDDDTGAGGMDGSSSQDPDVSIRSREEEDLPPLERARRRRSTLPGGQTQLVPWH